MHSLCIQRVHLYIYLFLITIMLNRIKIIIFMHDINCTHLTFNSFFITYRQTIYIVLREFILYTFYIEFIPYLFVVNILARRLFELADIYE